MMNRRLERERDTILYIIDDLVSEIEKLKSVNDSLRDKIDCLIDEVNELKYKLTKLES